ncbi:hypothetical protein MesoLjLc_51160 [Mesorhizobium sp. L-8-10]|nr:hypothetical protein MesoLjLc_51160 [Mesorhizobium sp. L-8-10]
MVAPMPFRVGAFSHLQITLPVAAPRRVAMRCRLAAGRYAAAAPRATHRQVVDALEGYGGSA